MEHKDYFFQKLTPANDIDISVYEEAIDYVFDRMTDIKLSGNCRKNIEYLQKT